MRRGRAPGDEAVRSYEHGAVGAYAVRSLHAAARVDHVVADALGVDGDAARAAGGMRRVAPAFGRGAR